MSPRKKGGAQTPAYRLPELRALLDTVRGADDLLPGAVAELGRRLFACTCGHPRVEFEGRKGHREGVGRCLDCEALDLYESSVGERCRKFRGSANASEAAGIVKALSSLSRHEGRADRELGLDKEVSVVPVMGWGITAEEAKKMSAEALDRYLLDRMGGGVVEAKKIEVKGE